MPGLSSYIKHTALRLLPEPLLFELKKRHYLSVLKKFRESDEPDLALVKRLVHEGDVVFDVGANIGVYSRFLSEYVGPRGAVHAFEPIPPTYSFLTAGVAALGAKNVTCHRLALSDEASTQVMLVPDYSSGGKNFYQARLSSSGESSDMQFEVQTERLDTVWTKLARKVSFIKVDVEGAEYGCFLGATALLEKDRPSLLIEINESLEKPGSSGEKLLQLLSHYGYRPYIFREGSVTPWESGASSVNYFFLTAAHFIALQT